MIGGRDFTTDKVNHAVPGGGGSGRQAGSSFKPFVLDRGGASRASRSSRSSTRRARSRSRRRTPARTGSSTTPSRAAACSNLDRRDEGVVEHGLRAADDQGAARRTSCPSRRAWASRRQLARGQLARARDGRGLPARHGVGLLDVRPSRHAHPRRRRSSRSSARRHVVERSTSRAPQPLTQAAVRPRHVLPAAGRARRHRHGCVLRQGRSPARPARRRTTRTRGSSASRRTATRPRCGWATTTPPRRGSPTVHDQRARPGRVRRNVPRDDLAQVHAGGSPTAWTSGASPDPKSFPGKVLELEPHDHDRADEHDDRSSTTTTAPRRRRPPDDAVDRRRPRRLPPTSAAPTTTPPTSAAPAGCRARAP